jgi:hypothetical protein
VGSARRAATSAVMGRTAFPADLRKAARRGLQTGCDPTAAELQAATTGAGPGQAQAGVYGRPGRTSSNSSRVRVRPASRQALASHCAGSIVNPRSTEPLVTTRRPSGANRALALKALTSSGSGTATWRNVRVPDCHAGRFTGRTRSAQRIRRGTGPLTGIGPSAPSTSSGPRTRSITHSLYGRPAGCWRVVDRQPRHPHHVRRLRH